MKIDRRHILFTIILIIVLISLAIRVWGWSLNSFRVFKDYFNLCAFAGLTCQFDWAFQHFHVMLHDVQTKSGALHRSGIRCTIESLEESLLIRFRNSDPVILYCQVNPTVYQWLYVDRWVVTWILDRIGNEVAEDITKQDRISSDLVFTRMAVEDRLPRFGKSLQIGTYSCNEFCQIRFF